MTAPTRDRRPAQVRRGRAVAVLPVMILLAGLLAAGLIAFPDGGSAPTGPAPFAPLRVTAGREIATGFAVGRDRVVTVAHVVDGEVSDGGTQAVRVDGLRARVLHVDRRSDLALLAVRRSAGVSPSVRAIAATSPAVTEASAGDVVRLVRLRDGRSSSQSVRVRRAIVAHVRAAGAARAVTRPALELAARVRGGDSGAPVVSRSGALAGVVFAASSRRASTAYAVDARAVTRLLARD